MVDWVSSVQRRETGGGCRDRDGEKAGKKGPGLDGGLDGLKHMPWAVDPVTRWAVGNRGNATGRGV
jgi:hypothetical protein